jgi:hypothetical protein
MLRKYWNRAKYNGDEPLDQNSPEGAPARAVAGATQVLNLWIPARRRRR